MKTETAYESYLKNLEIAKKMEKQLNDFKKEKEIDNDDINGIENEVFGTINF